MKTSLQRMNGSPTESDCTERTQLIFWWRPSAHRRFSQYSLLVLVTPCFLELCVTKTSSKMKSVLGMAFPAARAASHHRQYFSIISRRRLEWTYFDGMNGVYSLAQC